MRQVKTLAAAQPSKVVIIDDSLSMRRWISSVIARDSRLEVVGSAGTAEEARGVIKTTNPDVLSLDIEMPGIDGLQFLAHLMRLRPMPVVMLSAAMRSHSAYEQQALSLGAAACIAKPSLPSQKSMEDLCNTLVAATMGGRIAGRTQIGTERMDDDKILLVGASTGGVTALETLLTHLPKDAPPVVIAQHMPHKFLTGFVDRLNKLFVHKIALARDGMRLERGTIRFSPSQNMQTCVSWHSGAWHIQLVEQHHDHTFCPSVDVLFASGVPWAAQVRAAILTGLGHDGARGLLELRRNGAFTIGQSKESCAVYGMPGSALALNALQEEAPIEKIGALLTQRKPCDDAGFMRR